MKKSVYAIRVKRSEQKGLKDHYYFLYDDPKGSRYKRQNFKMHWPPEIGSFCIVHTPEVDWGPMYTKIENAIGVNQITLFPSYNEANNAIKMHGLKYVEYEVVEFQEK